MKIAVVHDYFTQLGGAERVVQELYRMVPDPALFATVALADCMPPRLRSARVQTSWMQNLPNIDRYYRFYFLLYPFVVIRERRANQPGCHTRVLLPHADALGMEL